MGASDGRFLRAARRLESTWEQRLKKTQRGEVMLAVMAVMLVVIWLGRGHMGMMGVGHVAGHSPEAVNAEQLPKGQSPAASAPTKPAQHQH
jgi:hypothetical protein